MTKARHDGATRRRHAIGCCSHCSEKSKAADLRRFAKPPEVGGRRGKPYILEIPGLSDWLDEQFREIPRPSFKEIEARLKKTDFWTKIRAKGFKTGKSTIHEQYVKWHAELARKRAEAEFAASFNETGESGDILAIEATITGLANIGILNGLRDELTDGKVTENAKSLIDLHRKLQSSSARREAERRAAGVLTRRAYEEARGEIVSILKEHPDALKLVLAAIDKAQNTTELKNAA